MIKIALVNTISVKKPFNEQNNKQQFNEQINLESVNNELEEPVFPIIAHQISNHININVGNLYSFFLLNIDTFNVFRMLQTMFNPF